MQSPLRIAILGCGAITRIEHLPTVLAHSGIRLLALVDQQVSRAQNLARIHGLECQVFTDYRSVFGGVDAVINALPNHAHAPVTLDCLQAGIHVLCEKPLAIRGADALACAKAAQGGQKILAVGMNRRFTSSNALLRLILSEGLLGELKDYDCQYGGAFDWKSASGFYFSKELAGGGALLDFGVHLLDSLTNWFGDVCAFDYQDDDWGSGIEANVVLDVQHESPYRGLKGHIKLSRTHKLANRLLVRGTQASAEISLHELDSVIIHRYLGGKPVTETIRIAGEVQSGAFSRQLDNFLAAISGAALPEVDGWQAARVLQLIENCYANARRIPEPWSQVEPLKTGATP